MPVVKRALSFLTVLGRAAEPDRRTLSWFPLVGVVVGALVGTVWWAAGRLWPAAVAALLATCADAAITGCLHLDGLADAADGLLAPVDAGRRLEIMADPRVGAFGAVTLVLVLGLRVGALAAAPARPLVLAGLWCGSRTLMATAARALPDARGGTGTVGAFSEGEETASSKSARRRAWIEVAAYGAVLAVGLAVLGAGARGAVAVAAEIGAWAVVVWFGIRRVGGMNGDVIGASGVIAETVGLLVLAAR
jgi:adenosylcobinamide-GDP ribazoletransferase